MMDDDHYNEVGVILALALPGDIAADVAGRLALDLRRLVGALPPRGDSPTELAISRDLLAAAGLLDELALRR